MVSLASIVTPKFVTKTIYTVLHSAHLTLVGMIASLNFMMIPIVKFSGCLLCFWEELLICWVQLIFKCTYYPVLASFYFFLIFHPQTDSPKKFKVFSTAVFSVVKFLQPVLGALEALASIPYLGTFFRLLHDLLDILLLGYRTFQYVTDSVCTISSPLYAALSFINTLLGFLHLFWFIFSAKYLKVECDTACNAARAEADAVVAMCMAEVPKTFSMAR